MKRKRPRTGGGRVRIIAGRWRGRLLSVPDGAGLRPTPDRVRETLFSWLQSALPGRRCLDLFAGSGALGLEAASREAGEVVLVEHASAVTRRLRESLRDLQGAEQSGVDVVQAEALGWLRDGTPPDGGFDVVFLDPPYGKGLLQPALDALAAGGWLSDRARLYIEFSAHEVPPTLPDGFAWLRDKTAGDVRFALAMRE
ncbi:MAG: 16S rRNA (guanine(966)-N(2))-methyltransferase RsmD [Gammaproteobacteria bacterium]